MNYILHNSQHCTQLHHSTLYRDEINSLQIQLIRTKAGPDRAVKEQQEQNSPNHVQRINLISVEKSFVKYRNCVIALGLVNARDRGRHSQF